MRHLLFTHNHILLNNMLKPVEGSSFIGPISASNVPFSTMLSGPRNNRLEVNIYNGS
jgi:hypothetical protein